MYINVWIILSSLSISQLTTLMSIFSFICMVCRSLFVLLFFFLWPLCCLFFFDIRILITPLGSLNSFYYKNSDVCYYKNEKRTGKCLQQVEHIRGPGCGGDCKTFEVMTSTQLRGTLGSVASLLTTTLYQYYKR
jgi:hypothetical protein